MEAILSAYIGSEWMPVVAAAVVLANAITMVTASKSDNPFLNVILKALNALSMNLGKNKNADAVEDSD